MLALVQVPGCLGDYEEPFLANGFQNIAVLLWDGCGVNVSYSKELHRPEDPVNEAY